MYIDKIPPNKSLEPAPVALVVSSCVFLRHGSVLSR